uniref:Hypothetical chloroplast RF21 n=1 Tax=Selaginella pennata TaxID=1715390 RepID=A0A482CJ61_9TRAC|nr:hypothetical chloroplast RF21 [Selaginella pennata]QBL76178.1 hypothetical chloroplast RF21 [Selaginella pennata]
MDEQSSVKTTGAKREIDKHCRGFWGVDWTLVGSLTATIPSNREHLPNPSHQFLVSNSPVLALALPVVGLGGRADGARGRNREPHPFMLERERVYTVRANRRSGCKGMHRTPGYPDKKSAAKPIKSIGGRKTSLDVPQLRYLRYFGRSNNDGYWVFDVWARREYRNIRSESNCSCAELQTGPRNEECSAEHKSYLLACTNRYTCFPLRSAPADRGGLSNNGSIIEQFWAVLDRSIPQLKKLSYNNWFVPQVHPRDVLSGACVSVSIFGNQNRLNAHSPTTPPRCPPSASLTYYAGGSEGRPGIVREGFITTSWKAYLGDLRITGHEIDTVTNRHESSQSGMYGIRSNIHEPNVLPCPGNSFGHPKTQIRIFRMGYEGFRHAVNQHPLNRRAGESNHWLNDRSGERARDKYVDLHPDMYEWSHNARGSIVFARYSVPRRNCPMAVYVRPGCTTGPIGRRMKCVKFSFIRERLNLMIHESEDADFPSDPINMIVHVMGTSRGVPGNGNNNEPPQSPDELEASSFSNNAMVERFMGLPRVWNEPDEAGCVTRPSRDITSAIPRRYNRFDPAKRIDMGSPLTCCRVANTPRSSDHLQLARLGPSCIHNCVGAFGNKSIIAYRQSRHLLPVHAEGLTLPDRVIPIIQSQIFDYVPYPDHLQGRCVSRPFFALARYACESLHLCSAQTHSLLFRGETWVGLSFSGNFESITTPFQRQRMGNLGRMTTWPHACAKAITSAAGTGGFHDSSWNGRTNFNSSGRRCQSRAERGIQNGLAKALRTWESSASLTDKTTPIGRGWVAAESDSEYETTSEPYPRPNEPVEGAEMCVASGDNAVEGGYKLVRVYTPLRLSTREQQWKYQGAISEAFEGNASPPRGNGCTNIPNVRRSINIDQPSRGPAIQLSRNNYCHNDEYPTTGPLPSAFLVLVKGSSYIDPRRRLAVVRYLTDALRKHQSDRSMHRGMRNHSIGRRNGFLPPSPPTNMKRPARSIGYSIRTGGRTNGWSDGSESLDLYPTVKALPIGFSMTGANIYRNELDLCRNHHKNDSGYRTAQEQGLYYSRYLAEGYENGTAHPPHHSDSMNWVSLASWQRVTPPNYTCRIPPVQVRSGFSPSRATSPIGSAETGRSYPMNDSAAYLDAHSIPISMSDLYEDERDFTMDDISMNGMRLLAASLCRFIPVLGLVEKIPRVIWIRDMHELAFKGRFARVGTELAPRSFSVSSARIANCTLGTIVAGSTHPPGETDPPLICANRSGRSTDVRALSIPRQQKELTALSRGRRFLLGSNYPPPSAFGSGIIMCYYARDPAPLTHEALLIGISHLVVVYGHANDGLVPLRQVVTDYDVCMDTDNHSEEYVYRVGRAAAHGTVIGIIPTSPSSTCGSDMKDPPQQLKRLPAWYLEPSIAGSTARIGFTRLSRVSGGLAGSARDDWSIADAQRDDSVRSAAEYDSTSAARGESENLVAGCPRSDTRRSTGEIGFAPSAQVGTPGSTAWNAIPVVPSPVLDEEGFGMTNDTTSAPAPDPRFVSNLLLSDWVQIAPQPSALQPGRTLANHLWMNPYPFARASNPLCYAHKRISSHRLSRMIEGAKKSRPTSVPSKKDRPEVPGVCIPIGCGRIGYQSNQSVLPIGKRFVWDGSLPIDRTLFSAFSHQPLFMDQGELVSDQGSMPKGLHAVRGNSIIGLSGSGADQQSSVHDIDDLVLYVASAADGAGIFRGSAPGERSADMLERTYDIGFRSERTHLFHPVHSYQARAFFESPSDTFVRSESPNHERWLEVGSPKDPPIHSTLPESHRYSLRNTRVANGAPMHQ